MPIRLNRKVRFTHPDFTYVTTTYTEFLYGAIGVKMNADIIAEVSWGSTDINAIFETTGDTITRQDSGSFWLDGFQVGDTVTILNTVSNNISTTITAISETGNVMTLTGLSGNETANACTIHGITTVTSIDFYPNLIPNSVGLNMFNLTDRKTVPRYTCDNITTDSANPSVMIATTNSMGWVTPADRATIYRSSTANYKQTFVISHTFTLVPLYLAGEIPVLERMMPPAGGSYQDRDCLKYAYVIEAKYATFTPDPPQSSLGYIVFPKGQTGWYNEFVNGRATCYTKESLLYFDNANAGALTAIDYCKVVDVTAKVVCTTLVENSYVTVHILYLPRNDSRYIDTRRSFGENFIYERALCQVGGATIQGENTGDYHFLKNVKAVSPSANHITVTFQTDYSTALTEFFDEQDADNLSYLIFFTIQNSL